MTVSLIVETGSASSTANSFVDQPTFLTYCANHGYDVITPGYTSDQLNIALITAGEYLRNEDRYPWRGQRVLDSQRMPWPRSGAVILYGTGTALAANFVPSPLQDAQCEIAFRALTSTVQPDLERGGGVSSAHAEGVSVTFFQDALRETLIMVAKGVLKPYLRRVVDLPMAPFLIQDLRGYTNVENPLVGFDDTGIQDRPGSDDEENIDQDENVTEGDEGVF